MIAYRKTNSTLSPYGTVSLILKKRDGTIKKIHKQNMHSLTNVVWRIFSNFMQGSSANYPRMSTGALLGISHVSTAGDGAIGFRTQDVNTWPGIIVGSGDTPMQATDWAMASLIGHAEANESFLASLNGFTVNPTGITISRSFDNSVGPTTINVNEVGLAMFVGNSSSFTNLASMILFARDVLDTTFSVEDGEILTVVYDVFFLAGNRNLQHIWSILERNKMESTGVYQRVETFYRAGGSTPNLDWRAIAVQANSGQARGIFLGSGVEEVTFDDIDLSTLITHGTGNGQLFYEACTIDNIQEDGTGYAFDVLRTVRNDTESSITVTEMGLFSNLGTVNMGDRTLLDRYILPTPIEIAPNESRVARWQFRYYI